jgi:hypothetical protein
MCTSLLIRLSITIHIVKFKHDGRSALVSNMQAEAREMETFPVLIGNEIAHFHEVAGGYNRERLYDVVNLIHRVQVLALRIVSTLTS